MARAATTRAKPGRAKATQVEAAPADVAGTVESGPVKAGAKKAIKTTKTAKTRATGTKARTAKTAATIKAAKAADAATPAPSTDTATAPRRRMTVSEQWPAEKREAFIAALAETGQVRAAAGVPPMLLGLPGDNTYANYSEANRALWRLTVLPLLAKIADSLSAYLSHWWEGLQLDIDRDSIPALAADRERLWRQVATADFLTDAQKRRLLGIAEEGQGSVE